MTTIAMDTHRVVKRLREVGFTDEQAETVTDVLRETRETDLGQLAAKADLATIKTDLALLKADLETTEARLETKIEAAKFDLLKWGAIALLGQAGLITALVKLL